MGGTQVHYRPLGGFGLFRPLGGFGLFGPLGGLGSFGPLGGFGLLGPLAWIIHDLSGEKRKDALKG